MGRPTLLNDLLQEQICTDVRAGAFLKHAGPRHGVGERTLMRWMERGGRYEAAVEQEVDPDPSDEPFFAFRQAVHLAQSGARVHAVASIVAAFGEDWRAAAWYLERTTPEFRRRVANEVDDVGDDEEDLDALHERALLLVGEVERRRDAQPVYGPYGPPAPS